MHSSTLPLLLVNVTQSHSSPFPNGPALLQHIRQTCSSTYRVIDIANLRLERIYDLLGLMESPGARLISIDTAPLHLAAAVDIPVVAITNEKPWLGTIPRLPNHIAIAYPDAAANPDLVTKALSDLSVRNRNPNRNLNRCSPPFPPTRRIFHAYESHPEPNALEQQRKLRARRTWSVLYQKHGVLPMPYTGWKRSAKQLGDARDLPYLKDVLDHAMSKAADADIIMLTNDDDHLHPDLPGIVLAHVAIYGAAASFRCDFSGRPQLDGKGRYAATSKSVGQDLFAFTKDWLRDHWSDIPDFLLGASEWDWCLTALIRLSRGIVSTRDNIAQNLAELPTGYVAHESHSPRWIHPSNVNTAPSQLHNRKLFQDWVNHHCPGFILSQYQGRSGAPAPRRSVPETTLIVRRTGALGDVLASTYIATTLMDLGHQIHFEAHQSTHCLLRRHPRIKSISEPSGAAADVNLDGAYERHPHRTKRHFADLFTEVANRQLAKRGISLPPPANFAPRLLSDPGVAAQARQQLATHPQPWVMICPRSQHWINRTVLPQTWQRAAKDMAGTKFWLGQDPAPPGIVDLQCRHVDLLIEYLAVAQLLVTVDTGPMHIAAALGTPVVAINQSSSPALHLSDQQDWTMIEPPLSCLNCQKNICPLDAKAPPCQRVDPAVIAQAVNTRLRRYQTEDISAIIAVYRPDIARLNKCLSYVLPQVQEVLIVSCLDTPQWPLKGVTQDGKIQFVRRLSHRTGDGKKTNLGARLSNGPYLWFLNDDVFPEPNVAQTLLSAMRHDPSVGIVSHRLNYPSGEIQYAGKHRDPGAIGFGHTDHRQRQSRHLEPVEQESVCGASMLVRRRAFYQAGCYDENFFLYSNDDDLAMAMRRAGYRILFHPGAVGVHIEHCSTGMLGNLNPLIEASNKIFHRKWSPYFAANPDPSRLGTFSYLKS